MGQQRGSTALPKPLVQRIAQLVALEASRRGVADTERAVAAALKVSQSQWHAIKKGENVGVSALIAIREFTGKSIDELLELDDSPQTAKIAAAVVATLQRQQQEAAPASPPAKPTRKVKEHR